MKSNFFLDTRGSLATLVALMAPVLLGFGALAVDIGSWHLTKRAMQTAADTAAISASEVLADGGTAAEAEAAGKQSAAANHYGEADGNTITISADTGSERATATISRPADLFLSRIIMGDEEHKIEATATAGPQESAPVCLLGLQGFDTGITENGGSATTDIWGTNCAIQANSSDSTALSTNGKNALIQGASVCANYSAPPTGNDVPNSDPPAYSCPPILDPFPEQLEPEWDGQASTCPSSMAPDPTVYSTYVLIHSGCYRNNDLKYSKKLVFETGGTFYLYNSSIQITGGNVDAVGVSVTFFLYGDSTMDLSGTRDMYLTAKPITSSTFPNILIAADASNVDDMTGGQSGDSKFGGSDNAYLSGIIYLPKQDVRVGGTGNVVATNASIVGNTITVVGNGQLTITAPDDGAPKRTAVLLLN
ncbi:MAG: hypothetical protein GC201_16115 [Alphaproteobacteria bacterium]|nr:hypothetical protein [Alphaproteobacteria bacterium]